MLGVFSYSELFAAKEVSKNNIAILSHMPLDNTKKL